MLPLIRKLLLGAAVVVMMPAVVAVAADDMEDLPPYKLIRSLQFVQDSVVLGDHSAIEMQRFMLTTIDERLRSADPSIFDDPRNVDAAFVYAMSGGNPETLEILANRDIDGHFDSRISDALRIYLNGKGSLTAKNLEAALPEYKNSKIGPYLALVSGNAIARKDPADALRHYDWARLTAPGTIVEEAALRRSIFLAAQSDDMGQRGMRYASSYARRFLHSPYASQFADLFVDLTVRNFEQIPEDDVLQILSFMDKPRQRAVYLRMARKAAIGGMQRLAKLAAERATALSDEGDAGPKVLADLYSGLADVPSADVAAVMQSIAAIPPEKLSARDRALQAAAKAVAEQVLKQPEAESLTQASDNKIAGEDGAEPEGRVTDPMNAEAGAELDDTMLPGAVPEAIEEAEPEPVEQAERQADPEFDGFVSAGRSKLDEIDTLLKGDAK